jgi:hypothetical protein
MFYIVFLMKSSYFDILTENKEVLNVINNQPLQCLIYELNNLRIYSVGIVLDNYYCILRPYGN